MKVAVYGSLRKGLHNYKSYLEDKKDVKFVGTFETDPVFTMIDLGSYPGVIPGGDTSIKMEVFDVTCPKIREDLDQLEGFIEKDNPNNFYNRTIINTPFGKALTYYYNEELKPSHELVVNGDWYDYYNYTNLVNSYNV